MWQVYAWEILPNKSLTLETHTFDEYSDACAWVASQMALAPKYVAILPVRLFSDFITMLENRLLEELP